MKNILSNLNITNVPIQYTNAHREGGEGGELNQREG
jgi:hypothetical protein